MKKLIKLTSDLRRILEINYAELDPIGFPFINMFPCNCCRGTSVYSGLIANKYFSEHKINIVSGTNPDQSNGHYWIEIDDKIYDLTIDQFLSWDNLKEQCPDYPIYALDAHPLESHFCHKVNYSPIEAFSFYCCELAESKDVITMYDALIK